MDLLTSIDPTGTSSSSNDPYHPSFFELIAQDQLNQLLKPATRYVLSFLAQRNPRYLLKIFNNFDEFYYALMLAIESHYLRVWGSSFSENFYGLKRRRRPALSTSRGSSAGGHTSVSLAASEALRPKEIRTSLFFLVVLPYLQSKLRELWERNGGGLDELSDQLFDDDQGLGPRARRVEQQPTSRRERVKKKLLAIFKTGYPYIGVLYQLWLLSYNVGYLFDRTPYWRPWLWFMRVDVRRMGGGDGPRRPILPRDPPNPLREPLRTLLVLGRTSPRILFESLKYALPASIFFFKFLEWWYGPENPGVRRTGSGNDPNNPSGSEDSILPPPKILPPHPKGILFRKQQEEGSYVDPKILTRSSPQDDEEEEEEEEEEEKVSWRTERPLIHNSCPLCGQTPINNPAVLESGYVFCYTCVHHHLSKSSRCPVTLLEIVGGTEGVRKVLG
ncbi:hypothetical protein IE53DRAFT_389609 [Violaceomyces palustris]|uniref:Uncharacterized protein n=1 Tax=Violaceomyces palustris TaxID=1673888 RepID=A0ACD0NQX9_9BASI|nr:hypothetical protein IE53DRAFT_389609 [Violaceomyces palustris]